MIDDWLFVLTLVSALGCGLIAGVFFAFSTFVMRALARLPPAQGIAAMQSINIVVLNPLFLSVLLGTAATCLVTAFLSLTRWHTSGAGYLLTGGLLYVVGTVLVTRVFNVPRNDALAAVDATSTEGAKVWASYVTSWTAWNHVRTVARIRMRLGLAR
ncbi:MAG: DUF1772 domain-containing protein [Luteitalea sp.]|nr:DUF1772 domain-containing protein [Luteitalea sp.]